MNRNVIPSALVLMIVMLATAAVNPALAIINDRPDGTGESINALPIASDPVPGQSGQDGNGVYGAPNSGDGIPDGSGWDHDSPGDCDAWLPPFSPLADLQVPIFIIVGSACWLF